MEENNKVLNTVKNIENSIKHFTDKVSQAKTISLICYISFTIFISIFVVLISLYFTISHASLIMIFSIVSLIISFIFLQVGIAYTMIVKYLYKSKLNNLLQVANIIKKDIKK